MIRLASSTCCGADFWTSVSFIVGGLLPVLDRRTFLAGLDGRTLPGGFDGGEGSMPIISAASEAVSIFSSVVCFGWGLATSGAVRTWFVVELVGGLPNGCRTRSIFAWIELTHARASFLVSGSRTYLQFTRLSSGMKPGGWLSKDPFLYSIIVKACAVSVSAVPSDESAPKIVDTRQYLSLIVPLVVGESSCFGWKERLY